MLREPDRLASHLSSSLHLLLQTVQTHRLQGLQKEPRSYNL